MDYNNPINNQPPVQNPQTDSFGYPVPQQRPQAPVQPQVNPYSQGTPNYSAPVPPAPQYNPYNSFNSNMEEPLSVGQWLLTIICLSIPCVNIIMLFVWAFGSGNKSRANYCKATF